MSYHVPASVGSMESSAHAYYMPPQDGRDPASASTARQYEELRIRYHLGEMFFSLCITGLFALAGPAVWLGRWVCSVAGEGILGAAVFTGLCWTGYSFLLLPWEYESSYRLEHRFHLSNQRVADWIKDQAKAFALKGILLVLGAAVLYVLLRSTGPAWWVWAGCCWLIFGILLSHLFPIVVVPLFFHVTPLTNEGLGQRLLFLAQKAGVHVVGMFQFDMSRRTKKANALFTGLGSTKRILLGDTLLEAFDEEEIEVIMAHEMGHCVRRHVARNIALSTVVTFAGFWLTSEILKQGTALWPSAWRADDLAALARISFFLSAGAVLAGPFFHAYSRHCERQADWFALEKTGLVDAFCRGMKKLARQNLSNPDPGPVTEFLFYTHPSISKRIRMAQEFLRRNSGGAAPGMMPGQEGS